MMEWREPDGKHPKYQKEKYENVRESHSGQIWNVSCTSTNGKTLFSLPKVMVRYTRRYCKGKLWFSSSSFFLHFIWKILSRTFLANVQQLSTEQKKYLHYKKKVAGEWGNHMILMKPEWIPSILLAPEVLFHFYIWLKWRKISAQ